MDSNHEMTGIEKLSIVISTRLMINFICCWEPHASFYFLLSFFQFRYLKVSTLYKLCGCWENGSRKAIYNLRRIMTNSNNYIFVIMEFGDISSISVNSGITHVSESPPSSPNPHLYTNSSGSSFEFPSIQNYSDFRDTQAEVYHFLWSTLWQKKVEWIGRISPDRVES